MRYRFLAYDPATVVQSAVKEWTAKLRVKYQLHDRGDHYEIELLALPKTSGIAVRYTTDGSSPTYIGYASYDGAFRVPATSRVVIAVAISADYGVSSDAISIKIPQRGEVGAAPVIDPTRPARWNHQTRLDDSTAVWDHIQRLAAVAGVRVHEVSLTAESSDGQQNIEYSGALDGGYDTANLKNVADKLQEIVGGGTLRMTFGSLAFPTGQKLLDWLKATKQSFDVAKVVQ